jgi:hypothetical protein
MSPGLPNSTQDALAQNVRIALAGFGQLDNPPGDERFRRVSTFKSKDYASQLERDAHDARRLGRRVLWPAKRWQQITLTAVSVLSDQLAGLF